MAIVLSADGRAYDDAVPLYIDTGHPTLVFDRLRRLWRTRSSVEASEIGADAEYVRNHGLNNDVLVPDPGTEHIGMVGPRVPLELSGDGRVYDPTVPLYIEIGGVLVFDRMRRALTNRGNLPAGEIDDDSWYEPITYMDGVPLDRFAGGNPGPGPGPTPIDPASVGALTGWWDFTDSGSVTVDGSGRIESVVGVVGGDAIQTDPDTRPYYTNGMAYWPDDRVAPMHLDITPAAEVQEVWVLLQYKNGLIGTFEDYDGIVGGDGRGVFGATGANRLYTSSGTPDAEALEINGHLAADKGSSSGFFALLPLPLSLVRIHHDLMSGSFVYTRIGTGNLATALRSWRGYIAEVLFFESTPTPEEHVGMSAYFAQKYASEASLNVGVAGTITVGEDSSQTVLGYSVPFTGHLETYGDLNIDLEVDDTPVWLVVDNNDVVVARFGPAGDSKPSPGEAFGIEIEGYGPVRLNWDGLTSRFQGVSTDLFTYFQTHLGDTLGIATHHFKDPSVGELEFRFRGQEPGGNNAMFEVSGGTPPYTFNPGSGAPNEVGWVQGNHLYDYGVNGGFTATVEDTSLPVQTLSVYVFLDWYP